MHGAYGIASTKLSSLYMQTILSYILGTIFSFSPTSELAFILLPLKSGGILI